MPAPRTAQGTDDQGRADEAAALARVRAGDPTAYAVLVALHAPVAKRLAVSWGYLKTVWQSVTPVSVGGREGVWLGASHLVEWVDRAGATHTEAPRLAGPTLAWVVPSAGGELTYRLQGPVTLERALEVAGSAR